MKREFSDSAIDREVRDLVTVDPSAGFEARVRARIAHHPPVSRLRWATLACAGGAVFSVGWLAVMLRPAPTMEVPSIVMVPQVPQWATIREVRKPAKAERLAARQTEAKEPELIISPEDSAALQQFIRQSPIQWNELAIVPIEPRPLPMIEMTPLTLVDLTKLDPLAPNAILSNGELK